MANYYANWLESSAKDALDQGNQMSGQINEYYNWLRNQGNMYNDQGNVAYNMNGGGPQGYTPEQAAGILQSNGSGGLNGVAPLDQNSWQFKGLFQSPEEAQWSAGNPNAVRDTTQANVNQLGTNITNSAGDTRGAVGNFQGIARDAAGNILSTAGAGAGNMRDVAGAGANSMMGVADSGASGITGSIDPSQFGISGLYDRQTGAAIDRSKLGLSSDFTNNFKFGPEDQQAMITSAGRSAGTRYRALADDIQKRSFAEGNTSPLAFAAATGRALGDSNDAEDAAMLNARIGAKNEALGVTKAMEDTRLGTEQDISNRLLGVAGQREGMRLSGAQAGQGLSLSAAENAAGLRSDAAKAAAGLNYSAAEGGANLNYAGSVAGAGLNMAGGAAGVQNEQDIAARNAQATEFGTTANLNAGAYADTAAADRSYRDAQNRQQALQYGLNTSFGQNMTVNAANSQRYQTVADQQAAQQQKYRDYLQNQAQFNTGGANSALNTANSNYGMRWGLNQNGMQSAAQNKDPSIFSQIMGGITGLAGAAGNFYKPKP